MRPAGKARGAKISGIFERRTTPPVPGSPTRQPRWGGRGMQRRPNARGFPQRGTRVPSNAAVYSDAGPVAGFKRFRYGTLVQWLLRPVNDRGAMSSVIAAPAASTSTAVSKRTRWQRVPPGPKPRRKSRLGRPRPRPRRPHGRQSHKRTSLGRRRLLVASSRARGRHAKSAAVEQHSTCSIRFSLQRCSRRRACHAQRYLTVQR